MTCFIESVEDLLASDRKDLSLDELFAADNKYFLYGLQKQWYEEWHAAGDNLILLYIS